MYPIRICKQVDSETIHLPELARFIGKTVEIIVTEAPRQAVGTEKDWEEYFAKYGVDTLLDPDIVKNQREWEKQHMKAPDS